MWAVIYILVAATLWSTIGVASVVGGDIAVLAFTRSLVAGLIGLLVVRSFKLSSLIAGVLLGVLFSSYPLSAVIAGVGVAAYLLYTAPLWATIASIAYGEKPGTLGALSVALILVAVALMGLEASRGVIEPAGLASGLIAGISYGLYIAVARSNALHVNSNPTNDNSLHSRKPEHTTTVKPSNSGSIPSSIYNTNTIQAIHKRS